MAGYSEVAPDDILNTIPYCHNNSTINVNYEVDFNNDSVWYTGFPKPGKQTVYRCYITTKECNRIRVDNVYFTSFSWVYENHSYR